MQSWLKKLLIVIAILTTIIILVGLVALPILESAVKDFAEERAKVAGFHLKIQDLSMSPLGSSLTLTGLHLNKLKQPRFRYRAEKLLIDLSFSEMLSAAFARRPDAIKNMDAKLHKFRIRDSGAKFDFACERVHVQSSNFSAVFNRQGGLVVSRITNITWNSSKMLGAFRHQKKLFEISGLKLKDFNLLQVKLQIRVHKKKLQVEKIEGEFPFMSFGGWLSLYPVSRDFRGWKVSDLHLIFQGNGRWRQFKQYLRPNSSPGSSGKLEISLEQPLSVHTISVRLNRTLKAARKRLVAEYLKQMRRKQAEEGKSKQ